MKPIATLINNNQPGWTNIIETEPNVTIHVGTKLYTENQVKEMMETMRMELFHMPLSEPLSDKQRGLVRWIDGWLSELATLTQLSKE